MTGMLLLDVVQHLVDNGLVQGDGIDAFRDFRPEDPDHVVVLYEYQGSPRVHYEPNVNRSVQVTVRDKDADVARQLCVQIYNLLYSQESYVVHFTPSRWGQVYLRQPPFRLLQDSKDRVVYGFNIGVTTLPD